MLQTLVPAATTDTSSPQFDLREMNRDLWRGRRNVQTLRRLVAVLNASPGDVNEATAGRGKQPTLADPMTSESGGSVPGCDERSAPGRSVSPARRLGNVLAALAVLTLAGGCLLVAWWLVQGEVLRAIRVGLPLAIIGQAILIGTFLFRSSPDSGNARAMRPF